MKKNIRDVPIAQWPHTGIPNLMGHMPEVHNSRTYIKEGHIRYNSRIIYPEHEATTRS